MDTIVEAARQHPDFDSSEAHANVADMLALIDHDPALFLERFGKFLGRIQLRQLSQTHPHNPSIAFWTRKWLGEDFDGSIDAVVANRRLRYLETTLVGSSYFDEAEMRRRDPAGWQYFIGEENDEMGESRGLGGFLLQSMERHEERVAGALQMQEDARCTMNFGEIQGSNRAKNDDSEDGRELWRQLHQNRFLNGQDEFFNYSAVDSNDAYDDYQQMARDAQESYFDDLDD